MNRSCLIIILILPGLILSSCFKEDEKITPHDPGDVITDSVRIANDGLYYYQAYYDLSSERIVSTNQRNTWDLGFEGSEKGSRIILNSANFMVSAESGITDFSLPIDTVGYTWKFDASSGNPDTTAFGGWVSYSGSDSLKIYSNQIYVIDRGYDAEGRLRGLKKVVFMEVTDTYYVLRFANLDGSSDDTDTVYKDPAVNFACFSFDDGGSQIQIEPPKDKWDLVFTQYTTLLYTDEGDPYPYLLTGILSNPAGVTVAQDTLFDFISIDLNTALSLHFTPTPDEIGYDWKDIVGDVSSGDVSYIIVEGRNYVVRDAEGFYYKLRFISFYSLNNGDKGVPTFEFQKL